MELVANLCLRVASPLELLVRPQRSRAGGRYCFYIWAGQDVDVRKVMEVSSVPLEQGEYRVQVYTADAGDVRPSWTEPTFIDPRHEVVAERDTLGVTSGGPGNPWPPV